MQQPIYLYQLIDPRTNMPCYVGLTIHPKKRLTQHKKDRNRYNTKIAKLCRKLYKLGILQNLRLEQLGVYSDAKSASAAEITTISSLRQSGYDLKNQLPGGYEQAPGNCSHDQIVKKMLIAGTLFGGFKHGEEASRAILTDNQVLDIYRLIKLFYSNAEIISELQLSVRTTTLTSIRNGENWTHLWLQYFTEVIPSTLVLSEWCNTRVKLDILSLYMTGTSDADICKKYPRLHLGDLRRAKVRQVWKKVWDLYDKYVAPSTSDC